MSPQEYQSIMTTLQLLITQQQGDFRLFRAALINYLQHELDYEDNLLKSRELS